ncbi:MAG: hypothetical protein V1913_05255 [Fibrobacterota bacterium]
MIYTRQNILSLLAVLACLALWSCEKAVKPSASGASNAMNFTVTDMGNGVYKIKFSRDTVTWEAPLLAQPALINVYRRAAGSENPTLVARSFGRWAAFTPGNTLTYRDSRDKVDSLVFTNADSVYDTVNNRSLQSFSYGLSAITGMDAAASGDDFSVGFVNPVRFSSEVFGGGSPVRLLIDEGRAYTPDNVVSVSGKFDAARVSKLIVYRYSQILPMDTLIRWLIKIDSAKGDTHATFQLKMTDTLQFGADSTVSLLRRKSISYVKLTAVADTDTLIMKVPFGKLGRTDTVSRAAFSTYFSAYAMDADGIASFSRTDTLVPGLGKKWLMLRGLDSTGSDSIWNPLTDDIDIQPYVAELLLDYSRARVRTNERERKVCLLNDDVPFSFRAFDTTFADSVTLWVATRNMSTQFFQNVNEIPFGLINTYYIDTTIKLPDCILETPSKSFVLDQYGAVIGSIGINDTMGFRVSSLNGSVKVTKPELDPLVLALTVAPGSILGYQESRLGRQIPQTNLFDDVLIYFDRSVPVPVQTNGWHTIASNDSLRTLYNRTSYDEYCVSQDKYLYINPFRNLPLNIDDAKAGSKEFVIIAYVRGKYFGEPRVFLSTASSNWAYVWDKMPPHATWNKQYDPAVNLKYAPMYYRDPKNGANDRVSNLTLLNNIFDVYLESDKNGVEGAVRDAGFGKITSVTLCFHYRDTSFNADPISNLREYRDGTPIKRIPLKGEQIAKQVQGDYATYTKRSFGIYETVFKGIDASSWQSGVWDTWIETADDLGNIGVAPYGGDKVEVNMGKFMVRSLEIK